VVVRQQSEAYNGDIVAAMIDEEATVKVYRRRAVASCLSRARPMPCSI
jgi:SOS-response transcriptional repressor LexA